MWSGGQLVLGPRSGWVGSAAGRYPVPHVLSEDPVVTRPLEGVRVLDLSRVVAGPFAGRMLSDLGADVVKVEPPEGDVTRVWGLKRHGVSGFFQQQNAGKRDICIDMRAEGSVQLIIELAKKADIVLENFRAGVMKRLGIDWTVLSAANPRLVMASISGFGAEGPDADRGAYAPVIQAESGLVHRQGLYDGRPPTDPILSIADYFSGLHATVGILSALRMVDKTGVGSWIDLAMVDAMLATDDYVHHSIDESDFDRLGGTYWQTGDGSWLMVSSPMKHMWNVASGQGVTVDLPPDAPLEVKLAARRNAIDAWMRSHPTLADLKATLNSLNVAWGDVRSMADAINSPTAKHRKMVVQVDDRGGSGTTRGVIDSPYRFSAWESGVAGGAPRRGEHNADVLGEWLGFDAARVESLVASGVLLAE